MAKKSGNSNGGGKGKKKGTSRTDAKPTATEAKPPRPEPSPEPSPGDGGPQVTWRDLHLWQIQPVRDVLVIAAIVGLIYLGYLLSIVTVPILIAILLAYLFDPVIRWMQSRWDHMSRARAVTVILAVGVIVPVTILAASVTVAAVQAVTLIDSLARNVTHLTEYVGEYRSEEQLTALMDDLREEKVRLDKDQIELAAIEQELSTGDLSEDARGDLKEAERALGVEVTRRKTTVKDLEEQLKEQERLDEFETRAYTEPKRTEAIDQTLDAIADAKKQQLALQDQLDDVNRRLEDDSIEAATKTDLEQEKQNLESSLKTTRERIDQLEADLAESGWSPDGVAAPVLVGTIPMQWSPERSDAYIELSSDGWRDIARWSTERFDFDPRILKNMLVGLQSDMSTAASAVLKGARSAGSALQAVFGPIMAVVTFGFTIFLTCFFFFFIATGFPAVLDFARKLIPDRHRDVVLDLTSQMDRVVAGFIRGRLTICLILSGVFVLGYWIVGTPGALVLGILVGALSIVPYLALIGIPLAIALMFLEPTDDALRSHWMWILIAPTAIYFIGQALDDYLLTPKIQGKTTNMDTPTILFASLAGGTLLGIYGLLLAIPVAACLKILIRELVWPRFRAWAEGKEKDFLPISRGE